MTAYAGNSPHRTASRSDVGGGGYGAVVVGMRECECDRSTPSWRPGRRRIRRVVVVVDDFIK
jgi:hypothetical protein